jgi:DUF1680 family protein
VDAWAVRGELKVDGQCVILQQKTEYPWNGTVTLTVTPEVPATVDNGRTLSDVSLPRKARLTPTFEPALLGGIMVIKGKAQRRDPAPWKGQLYRHAGTPLQSIPIKAVPYAVWANRAPGEMLVWIRESGKI